MPRYFIGVDIGTYESKGVLIDEGCGVLCQAVEKHGMENPAPGHFEHDAEEVWWGDTRRIIQRLLADSGASPEDVACVGTSALGCDCLAVDERCRPLHKAILYGIDARAEAEIAYIHDYFREEPELFDHPLVSSSIAPKILWLKNHMPQVHARAHKFLTASSFLAARLTGNYTIDRYLAPAFAPLYDLEAGRVDEMHCGLFCRPDQLAEPAYATDIAGVVTAEAAAATGLRAGTPVIVGSGDSGSEAISAGVLQPGDLMVQLGSSCFFIYCTDRPVREPRLWPGPFIVPGTWCVAAGTNTAGTLTRWFRDQFFPELLADEAAGGESAYAVMARLAAGSPPGSRGLVTLPYFAGERTPVNDPLARGCILGLTVNHTKADLLRSALEGIACSIAQHLDILAENRLPVNRVLLTGGGVHNPVWVQAIADVLQRPVFLPKTTIGACYGGAVMAALAGGACRDWAELSRRIGVGAEIRPAAETAMVYRELRAVYDRLYPATRELMHALPHPNTEKRSD